MVLLANNDEALHAWGELVIQLVPLIIVIGLVGVVVIMGLLIAWRRQHARQQEQEAHQAEPTAARQTDGAWETAGQRLEVMPNPARPSAPAEEDRYADDEEDDEDAPWRESLGDIPEFESEYDRDREDDEPDEDWGTDDDAEDDAPPPWSR